MAHITRLFVDHPLGAGQSVPLGRDEANRLFNVMRLAVGAELRLINGRDGEWRARIAEAGKRAGRLWVEEQTAPLRPPADLWLLFAPIKRDRTEFIVEKATELGVARILPVRTDYTQSDRLRHDKLMAHAIAAVEQCGATSLPEIGELTALGALLETWPSERQIMFCDETAKAGSLPDAPGPWAIIIGPEGGFSPKERETLRAMGQVISLGPRILRADTAAIAAITLWQAHLGDWR